jgi:UDP-N-acetylmuramate dehydrogenase
MEWKGIKGQVLNNVLMKRYTSMKVGGPACCMVYPADEADLSTVLGIARREGIGCRFLGNGTNIIVADKGLDEAIIRITRMRRMHFSKTTEGAVVEVSGGVSLARLIRACADRGLAGMGKLYGIPGTVAGAVKMNAGSFGVWISDHLRSVTCMSRPGRIEQRERGACGFGYRASAFTRSECIVSAVFELPHGNTAAIRKEMEYVWGERLKRHPMELPSSGSIFKNSSGRPSWECIDKAGLRGFCVGDACVSEKHANFIVNRGNATAADIERLIKQVAERVYERTGVVMETEVEFWGTDG